MSKYKFSSEEPDYKHLIDKERYKNLYEEVCTVEANKKIKWREEWMKYFHPKPNSLILELGSHNGQNLLKYAGESHFIDGVELSQTLIETFNQYLRKEPKQVRNRINVYQSWVEEFKTDKEYNYVVLTEILEYVIDPVAILKITEMYLKEDGSIYITSPLKLLGKQYACKKGAKGRFDEFACKIQSFSY